MAYPPTYNVPPSPVNPEPRMVQEFSIPIYQARGWLKFLGILSIMGGIGQALSIVGLLIAWLPIWMGILLFQAGSSIDSAGKFGDKFAFLRSMGSLKTYFVLQGVLILVMIILMVSMLCIMFVLPLLGLTLIPWQQIIDNFPQSY
jgi:hypothetical protein